MSRRERENERERERERERGSGGGEEKKRCSKSPRCADVASSPSSVTPYNMKPYNIERQKMKQASVHSMNPIQHEAIQHRAIQTVMNKRAKRHEQNCQVPHGKQMLVFGTDPESYITEYSLVYEENTMV